MDNETRQYGQDNLTLPHDVVTLPSGGVFYKNKKKSVKVGYLTASDENILLGNTENIVLSLLRSKVYEPDIKPEDMLEGDIEAILIFLRNTSFGPEINLTLTDSETGKQFRTTVVLDQLPIVKNLDPEPDGTFVTTLPKSGKTVKIRPLTYGEVLDVDNIVNSYPSGRVAPKVTYRLQKEIQEVDGITDKGEIAKFVEQMPIMDSKHIRKFMNDNEPRLNMLKIVNTPSGGNLTVNVGFGADFFRPFFGL